MVNRDLVIEAEVYYRSEVTASSPSAPTGSSRILVDCGERSVELPSQLHLDLLQLLQETNDGNYDSEDTINKALTGEDVSTGGYVPGGPPDDTRVRVSDLYEAMGSLTLEGDDDDESFSWPKFKEALRWLYDRNLVSFEDTAASSPEKLFGAADSILDLRGLEKGSMEDIL